MDECDVVVVGAGPTGLSATLCLVAQGLDVLVLEARSGPHEFPAAHVINGRSLEIFRSLGAYERLIHAKGAGRSTETSWVRQVSEPPIAVFGRAEGIEVIKEAASRAQQSSRHGRLDPQRRFPVQSMLNLAQPIQEKVLAEVIKDRCPLRHHVRYGHEAVDVKQDDEFAHVRVNDGGGPGYHIKCRYVLACDGASSRIREELRVKMETSVPKVQPKAFKPSDGIIQHHAWIYFKCDLSRYFTDGQPYGPALWWFFTPSDAGLITNYNGHDEWVMHTPFFPEEETHPTSWPQEFCTAKIQAVIGENLPLEIGGKGAWQMTCSISSKYRIGRIFLAGDSCHRFPPSGGHGQNTGLEDVHNLAWKLAAVLRGWAHEELLQSYEEERWPVGRYNGDQSARNNRQMAEIESAIGLIPSAPFKNLSEYRAGLNKFVSSTIDPTALRRGVVRSAPHWMSEGQQFGFTYEEGALVPDGTPLKQAIQWPRVNGVSDGTVIWYEPTTRPGSRLPHAWVKVLRGKISRISCSDTSLPAYPRGPGPGPLDPASVYVSLHDTIGVHEVTLVTTDGHADWDDIVLKLRCGRASFVPWIRVHLCANHLCKEPCAADVVVTSAPQPEGEPTLQHLLELPPGGCLLVRPDQFVGCRVVSVNSDTIVSLLERGLLQIARKDGQGNPIGVMPNPCRRSGDWPEPKARCARTLNTSAIISPTQFAHAVLRTTNMEASIRFYQSVLSSHVVHKSEYLAFLTYDEEHHRLALIKTSQVKKPPPNAAGLDHLAYTLRGLQELLQTYCRLRREGIVPVWTINHGPTTSIYYSDPDGHKVKLQVDNFSTEEKLKGYMASEAFQKNPIGEVLDAEVMVERFLSGQPLELVRKAGALSPQSNVLSNPRSLDASQMIAPSRFAHVVLRTGDLKKAGHFYQRVLGAHVVHKSDKLVFLTYDDEHHRIILVETTEKQPGPPGAAGLDHLAYSHAGLPELLQTYCRLRDEGILPVWIINHGPTTSMYYQDPDGNKVELQVDNFATEAELKGYMNSDSFNQNPIGHEFDADALVQSFLNGEPIDALLDPARLAAQKSKL